MSRRLNLLKYIMLRASGILIVIILWEALPALKIIDPRILPRFTTVIGTLFKMFYTKDLFMNIFVSLWRVLNGLLIASVIGISLGIILATFFLSTVEFLNPLFRILSQVNPFSLMPVFILFFGIGEEAKLAIVAWVCIWPILFNTIIGVRTINPVIIKTARSMNISPKGMVFKIILPSVAPSIFIGLRLGVQISFFMLIAGEMLGANAGLGLLLHTAGHYYDAPMLYASGLSIVILGVSLNRFFKFLENGMFFWKEEFSLTTDISVNRKPIRLGKPELALITLILIGVLFIGSQEVQKANLLGQNPIKHEHNEK